MGCGASSNAPAPAPVERVKPAARAAPAAPGVEHRVATAADFDALAAAGQPPLVVLVTRAGDAACSAFEKYWDDVRKQDGGRCNWARVDADNAALRDVIDAGNSGGGSTTALPTVLVYHDGALKEAKPRPSAEALKKLASAAALTAVVPPAGAAVREPPPEPTEPEHQLTCVADFKALTAQGQPPLMILYGRTGCVNTRELRKKWDGIRATRTTVNWAFKNSENKEFALDIGVSGSFQLPVVCVYQEDELIESKEKATADDVVRMADAAAVLPPPTRGPQRPWHELTTTDQFAELNAAGRPPVVVWYSDPAAVVHQAFQRHWRRLVNAHQDVEFALLDKQFKQECRVPKGLNRTFVMPLMIFFAHGGHVRTLEKPDSVDAAKVAAAIEAVKTAPPPPAASDDAAPPPPPSDAPASA